MTTDDSKPDIKRLPYYIFFANFFLPIACLQYASLLTASARISMQRGYFLALLFLLCAA